MAASALSRPSRRRWKFPKETLIFWLVLTPLAIAVILPLFYMTAMAFTPEQDQLVWPIQWIPQHPTAINFQHIFSDATLPVARWFMNSVLVASVGMLIVLFLSSLSAYAFARLEFPGRSAIFSLLLVSLMIPGAVTLIPSFLLLRDLQLLDTYHAIWWPGAASVGGIFLLRQHFFAIPKDLEDAANVDGAGRFRIYWQICLPLVRSAMIALAIFTFLGFWNDLFWPLIVLSDRANLTLPIGLLVLSQGSYIQRGLAFAGAFIGSAPPLVFYAVFQRQIIQGITTAGLAGR
ncbi:MAG: carbohydrate ABC transporter permease [Chloroflexi bacterium]|nr:carbohydrate ABC transporter permease [Chloroflexota bacterium]